MRRRAGVVTAIGTAVLAAVAVVPPAQAQFAVIDVAAIRHLVVQIDYWRQQIEAMSAELTQLEATHAALTGPRGMEALLAITPEQRNYLPGEWEAMRAALEGQSAEYGALARAVGAVVELRAVLSEAVLAEMTEAEEKVPAYISQSLFITRKTTALIYRLFCISMISRFFIFSPSISKRSMVLTW